MKKHLIRHIKKHMALYMILGGVYKLLITGIVLLGVVHLINTPLQHSSAQTLYTITATTTDGGTVEPKGEVIVNEGDTISFVFKANPGFMLTDVQVDGKSMGQSNPYTFENVSANHTIHGIFERVYTITAQAENGATITPEGTVQVPANGSQKFTFGTISNIYGIKAIIINKTPISPLTTTYTFTDVRQDYSLIVQGERLPKQISPATTNCEKQTVTILLNDEINTISPSNNIIISQDKTYQQNARILTRGKNLEIDTKDLPDGRYEIQLLPNTLINESLLTTQTIFFPFEKKCATIPPKTYDITIKIMSPSGTTNPAGEIKNNSQPVSGPAAPSAQPVSTTPLDEKITVTTTAPSTPTELINTPIGLPAENPTLPTTPIEKTTTPLSERVLTVNAGANQTITLLPDPGYTYDKIIVDNTSTITNATSITFSNIQSNHTLEVYFKPVLTASSQGGRGGGGGSISLSIDNCPYGDFSASYYDGKCGDIPTAQLTKKPETINIPTKCADENYLKQNLVTCLGLAEKVKLLKALNDRVVQTMTNIGQRDSTILNLVNNNTQEYTLRTKVLQSAADGLTKLNNTLINMFNNQAKTNTPGAK